MKTLQRYMCCMISNNAKKCFNTLHKHSHRVYTDLYKCMGSNMTYINLIEHYVENDPKLGLFIMIDDALLRTFWTPCLMKSIQYGQDGKILELSHKLTNE